MWGLGKYRTAFGKWMDRKEISQIELEEESGLSRRTISRLCNDKDYRPKLSTVVEVKKALKAMGHKLPPDRYFG